MHQVKAKWPLRVFPIPKTLEHGTCWMFLETFHFSRAANKDAARIGMLASKRVCMQDDAVLKS